MQSNNMIIGKKKQKLLKSDQKKNIVSRPLATEHFFNFLLLFTVFENPKDFFASKENIFVWFSNLALQNIPEFFLAYFLETCF